MAPILEYFNGLRIEIYSREHMPVHIHVKYGEQEAIIDVKNSKILLGYIPRRKFKILEVWLNEGNRRALIEKNFFELNPHLKFNNTSTVENEKK
jgi:hypothetical protein